MKSILFTSANRHKVEEVAAMLGRFIHVKGLADIGFSGEIPETTGTIEGNARQKARFIYDRYSLPCFADDSGLEVHALANAPGVDSAHYAGPQRSAQDNISLLLSNLSNIVDRRARFRTVICFFDNDTEYVFEGLVNGVINTEIRGATGFGYDPVFIPDGYSRTFAEMSHDDKNLISHRSRAITLLLEHLRRYHS